MSGFKREKIIPSWSIKPKITVLLPVYNHAKFIRSSIESILGQKDVIAWGANLKIYVLNDGSNEPIRPLIEDFIEASLISYSEKKNAGLPSALNELYSLALAEPDTAKPDFLSWHSADNLYLPESLFKMASFLCANPDLDFTYANVQLINDSSELFYNSQYRTIDQRVDNTSVLNLNYPVELLSGFGDNFINACFLERTTSSLLAPRYDPACKGFEDYLHWMNLSLSGTGEHLGEKSPLYQYRLHDNSMSSEISANYLVSEQQKFLVKASEQRINVSNGLFQLHDLALINIESKKEISRFKGKINGYSHIGHLEFQKISTKIHASPYGNDCFILGSYEGPNILKRARERYLGLFESDYEQSGRVVIFMPDDAIYVKGALINFIRDNRNLGIALYCTSLNSRSVADSLYLETNLASNLRIIDCTDASENAPRDGRHISLLNTIGSCDAIVSISAFYGELADTLTEHLYLLNDFCAEACLSACAGRVLLAPAKLPELLTGPLVHIFPWDSRHQLPKNLSKLKTHLTNAHYDATLRVFSEANISKRHIHSLIFSSY